MDQTVLPGIKENVLSDFYLTPDYFEIDLAPLCRRKVQTMQDYMQYFLRAP